MNPDPLVSVCVITYNHAPFIRECLDRILAQTTNFPYEICIGEDGSDDGTREICLEYAQRFSDKIRLFLRDRSDPLREEYRAVFMFNFIETVTACRGEYVAFCEGDDCWLSSDKLQLQADFLSQHRRCALIASDIVCGKTAPAFIVQGRSKRLWVKKYNLEDLLCFNRVVTATVMIRRDQVEFPEWFKALAMGDWMLWILSARKGWIAKFSCRQAFYRHHSGGVWSTTPREDQRKNGDSFFVFLRERLVDVTPDIFDRVRKRRLYYRMIRLAQEGKLLRARSLFKKIAWAVWISKERFRIKVKGFLWVFSHRAMHAQMHVRNKELTFDR